MPGANRETPVIKETVDDLNEIPGVKARRVNSGRARGGWIQLAEEGTADIVGWISPRARTFGIEMKAIDGVLSDAQRKWGVRLEADGGIYIVSTSKEHAIAALLRRAGR